MLLQWILVLLVLISSFLLLTVLLPQTQWILAIFWFIALTSDLHSTHQFYVEEPSNFSRNERNKVFVFLTKKLGFKKASVAFPVIFEIPLLLFFALLPMQTLYTYMFPNAPLNLPACFATSFGVAAVGHIQAASKNRHFITAKSPPSQT
jgi:hypothetical protein